MFYRFVKSGQYTTSMHWSYTWTLIIHPKTQPTYYLVCNVISLCTLFDYIIFCSCAQFQANSHLNRLFPQLDTMPPWLGFHVLLTLKRTERHCWPAPTRTKFSPFPQDKQFKGTVPWSRYVKHERSRLCQGTCEESASKCCWLILAFSF